MKKNFLIKKMSDWESLSDELLLNMLPKSTATIVTLDGDLGAGKTTFVQTLAKKLGVSEVVTSPTFSIMKSYTVKPESGFMALIHMDAYRIDNLSELTPLRFFEILKQPNIIICIEWAQKIKNSLPEDVVSVAIKHIKGEEREVEINF